VDQRAARIEELHAGNPWEFESEETTHFSVVDQFGNTVSNTYTLGSDFGAGVVMEGTGFLLGNLIGNFSIEKQARMRAGGPPLTANLLAPGRRPVSSMSPTIIFRNGKPWIVTGSPGGSTIIGTVAQLIVNSIDFDMNIAEATTFPRVFQNIDTGELRLEPGISPDTQSILRGWGHNLTMGQTMGSAQSIRIEGDELHGGVDPRRPGASAAPL
jgi:gamma-glutamyltranspeptidase/glutathione hydrolase